MNFDLVWLVWFVGVFLTFGYWFGTDQKLSTIQQLLLLVAVLLVWPFVLGYLRAKNSTVSANEKLN